MAFVLLLLSAVILWFCYKYAYANENFFKGRGVKFIKPLPFFGSSFGFITNKENLISFVNKICKNFRNEKVFGVFDFRTPILVIRDPEMCKNLAIKEFDHFTDHLNIIPDDFEPMFSSSLFLLGGHKWREMRTTLSPAFTGSKMRLMCDFVVEICEQTVAYVKKEAQEAPKPNEVRELFTRVAADMIGTCAFGIKVDSLNDKKNMFFESANAMFDPASFSLTLKVIAARTVPWLLKLLRINLFDEKYRGFLKNLVLENMKTRQEKNIVRPDMINLLIEAQKGTLENASSEYDSAGFATVEEAQMKPVAKKTSWTEDEIVAQCFIFFLAGFDTSSTILSFAAYEIARYPQVQEKLYQEAKMIRDELKGKPIKYETLQKMKYLDMVVSETLRMWPVAPFVDRMCTKEFTMEYDKGKKYTFHKGETLWIPIGDFHFNPEYFPDPNKFDPERFSDENKYLINPNTYLPFGIGPRNCIGSRFALMQIKSLLYSLIVNFHFDLSDKTEVPLVLAGSAVGLKARSGVWIKFRLRE
ncbi:probable cytochrome P450 9f2 [Phlebotomus argentipes]|uniref:probable cytochrome P450 9f2 n=1 Tax=Phlebotomus argentipes TaxID=94469 RepID=UPI002892E541|nr:probable cytochrome P450 9f2 [Phlebotomus argentipes]